jgi:adenylosuccinate synthase
LLLVASLALSAEGKGHVAAQIAARRDDPLVIRTGGPNAGHSVLDERGAVYKLRQLPTSVISNPHSTPAIAAGSLIDPVVLLDEIKATGLYVDNLVLIDPNSTVLEPRHLEQERADSHLSNWSTQKGIGAARADRIHRTATIARDYDWGELTSYIQLMDVARLAQHSCQYHRPIVIEAAQGYGLGLHTDYYPKTTSANCRAIDALADVGLSPWRRALTVWLAVRPYPIRVAGESGPLKGETSWDELGLPEERTTVTNKVRRVGQWDARLVRRAIRANGGPAENVVVALTMFDTVAPDWAGLTKWPDPLPGDEVDNWLWWHRELADLGAPIKALGTGPGTMIFLED